MAKAVGAAMTLTLGVVLTLLAAGLFLSGTPLLDVLELKTYDMRLRAFGAAPPKQVTIAAIDERSLAVLGRWPWSRSTLAKLTDRLDQAGARVVAYDVFFPERESQEADRALADAVGKGRAVVLASVFLGSIEETRHLETRRIEAAKNAIAPLAIGDIRPGGTDRFSMHEPLGVLVNIPELQSRTRYAGHINVLPDADGVVRRAPLVVRYAGNYYPSFDVQAARAYAGGKPLVLHTADYGITGIEIGERRIPVDEEGQMLVRYRGPERTFATVSIADILDGSADVSLLRDRVVVVGSTAKGIADFRSTPVGAAYPGVEIRASIIQNLIEGEVLRHPEWMTLVDAAVIVVLGLLLALLLPRMDVTRGALMAVATLFAYMFLANHLFRSESLWINIVYPSLLTVSLFVSTTLMHYFSSESQKRYLKNAFQHYVPREVVNDLVADAGKLRLGGEKRELTVLFSDIRGFTTMSETLPPEDLVRLLNVYFTAMTNKVFAHRGSLDKYIGDAIMAVFGAPVADARHARLACLTALDMMQALGELQASWQRDGLPAIDIGIGINTGPMIVGNMGSENRFNYTVVGDAVNVASRLESMNKTYGTHILVSEFTMAQVPGEFPNAREIDRVQVRGRAQAVGLYELIPHGRFANLDWLDEFAAAYALLRSGDATAAAERFDAIASRIGDPVSAYHARRLRQPKRRGSDDE